MHLPRVLFDVEDLRLDAIGALLARAQEFASGTTVLPSLSQRTVGLYFEQPSTRTRVGFTAAAARLGGSVANVSGAKFQPGMDGPESIGDTARVLGDYCDVLVVRHGRCESVREFASASAAPVINGGAGRVAHPTQALIDLFALQRRFATLCNLAVGIAGDLATSRTGRSFLKAIARFAPAEVRLMAPAGREMPEEVVTSLSGINVTERSSLDVRDLDVLYVAGMPPGTGEDRLSSQARAAFYVTARRLSAMSPSGAVLCALPRTGDIDPDVDGDPRAWYFRQSAEGLFMRMALLEAYAAEARHDHA